MNDRNLTIIVLIIALAICVAVYVVQCLFWGCPL